MTGGGALLRDLDVMISEQAGIPVIPADDPLALQEGELLRNNKYDIDLLSTD